MIRTPRLVTNRYGVFAVRILIPATQTGRGKASADTTNAPAKAKDSKTQTHCAAPTLGSGCQRKRLGLAESSRGCYE